MDYLSTCTMMLDARKWVAGYNMGRGNKSFGVADAPVSLGWKGCTYRLGMLPSEHQYWLHPRADTLLCSEYGMGSLVDSERQGPTQVGLAVQGKSMRQRFEPVSSFNQMHIPLAYP